MKIERGKYFDNTPGIYLWLGIALIYQIAADLYRTFVSPFLR